MRGERERSERRKEEARREKRKGREKGQCRTEKEMRETNIKKG